MENQHHWRLMENLHPALSGMKQGNVAIFLIRRLTGEKLEEIGRQFGIAKYSSVSSAIEKMKRDISADPRLKARVKNIEKIL